MTDNHWNSNDRHYLEVRFIPKRDQVVLEEKRGRISLSRLVLSRALFNALVQTRYQINREGKTSENVRAPGSD